MPVVVTELHASARKKLNTGDAAGFMFKVMHFSDIPLLDHLAQEAGRESESIPLIIRSAVTSCVVADVSV